MSSSYLFYSFGMPNGKEPNWDVEITDQHILNHRLATQLANDEEDDKGVREILQNGIQLLKDGWEDNRRDCGKTNLGELQVIHTGGMSWGDSPTDFFDVMDVLYHSGVAESMGFIV